MDPQWFTSPTWWDALTLAERAASLANGETSSRLSEEQLERGQRRLAHVGAAKHHLPLMTILSDGLGWTVSVRSS